MTTVEHPQVPVRRVLAELLGLPGPRRARHMHVDGARQPSRSWGGEQCRWSGGGRRSMDPFAWHRSQIVRAGEHLDAMLDRDEPLLRSGSPPPPPHPHSPLRPVGAASRLRLRAHRSAGAPRNRDVPPRRRPTTTTFVHNRSTGYVRLETPRGPGPVGVGRAATRGRHCRTCPVGPYSAALRGGAGIWGMDAGRQSPSKTEGHCCGTNGRP